MTLSTKQISFIVQGPIQKDCMGKHGRGYSTEECLLSIRRHFPESTIILSTWEGEEVPRFLYDIAIQSRDPGELTFVDGRSNINRLLLSTQRGIERAVTDFVCKTRTDIYFTSDALVHLYRQMQQKFPQQCPHLTLPAIVHEKFTKSALFCKSHHFHISDIFLFGGKRDIADLFSLPQATADRFIAADGHNEVYLWRAFGKSRSISSYEEFLAKNTCIADSIKLGIWTPFDDRYSYANWLTLSYNDWRILYRYYEQNRGLYWPLFYLKSLAKRIGLELTSFKRRARWEALKRSLQSERGRRG